MSLFRIWPFRILLIAVVALLVTDLALVATSGRSSKPLALHVVAASDYTVSEPSPLQEIRRLHAASRSHVRTSLPQAHPQVVHVTCWNGKVVIEHPGVQDCPDRPKPKPIAVPEGVYAWAHASFSILVANCESGGTHQGQRYNGDPHNRNNPRYRGKWQMGFPEWADEGGSGDPADASEAEQDYRAWKLWKARGWQPWQCAGMV